MAIGRPQPRTTTTTTQRTKISVRVATTLVVVSIGAVLGLLAASIGIRSIGPTVSIALIGPATDSAYPFPGQIKIFGQRSITQTASGAIVGNRTYHPSGVAVDTTSATATGLYVADAINNRILAYRTVGSCSTDTNRACSTDADCSGGACTISRDRLPDAVIGQADFTSGACNRDNNIGVNGSASASSLCFANYPKITNVGEYGFRIRMTTDANGNLYVADAMNNRILRYNQPLGTSTVADDGKGDAIADYVWGQTDFSGRLPNGGGPVTANSLSLENLYNTYGPGLTIDSAGNLWVADTNNSRVLRFSAGPDGVPVHQADRVIGQSNFTSSSRTCDGLDPYGLNPVPPINTPLTSFCFPGALQFDNASQVLYVADQHSNRFRSRLLAFTAPNTDATAVHVIAIKNPNLVPFQVTTNASGNPILFYYYPQLWDIALNTNRTGALSSGLVWIVESILQRAALIDADGNII